MKIGWKAAGAAAALAAGVAGTAQAQTPEDIAKLDRLSQGHRFVSAPAVPPPARQERLLRPRQQWTCMGTIPDRPVYTSPDPTSPPMALTQPHVAASGATSQGMAQVLATNGRIGWVPVERIFPYINQLRPGTKCQVAGVRTDNSPVFRLF